MPGPLDLGHKLQDSAVIHHHVMRRDTRLGIAEPVDRLVSELHPGVMQDDHVWAGKAGPLVKIRRRLDAFSHA